jgi:hypothetical protein
VGVTSSTHREMRNLYNIFGSKPKLNFGDLVWIDTVRWVLLSLLLLWGLSMPVWNWAFNGPFDHPADDMCE